MEDEEIKEEEGVQYQIQKKPKELKSFDFNALMSHSETFSGDRVTKYMYIAESHESTK